MERNDPRDTRLNLDQAKDRFSKLKRREGAYNRQGLEYDPLDKIEQIIIDKRLSVERTGWYRHYTEQAYDEAVNYLDEVYNQAGNKQEII